jgi:hypothetical protein
MKFYGARKIVESIIWIDHMAASPAPRQAPLPASRAARTGCLTKLLCIVKRTKLPLITFPNQQML